MLQVTPGAQIKWNPIDIRLIFDILSRLLIMIFFIEEILQTFLKKE